ncbi:hypothetical protein [Enterococcus sp. DIV0187]
MVKLNNKDENNIKYIIEKYEHDIEVYIYLTNLLKIILKENKDK